MRHEEHDAQCQLIEWCEIVKLSYHDVGAYFATATEGKRTPQAGKRRKNMGVRSGVPDLCWPVPHGKYHGLFVEMKRPKGGVVSDTQETWIAFLLAQGYAVEVCHGLGEAIAAVSKYFGVRVSA